jgi:hypothetical protein
VTTTTAEQPVKSGAIEYGRPPLYPQQAQAIFGCIDHAPSLPACVLGKHARYAITEASTKSGKTHGCIAWLLELALINGTPGRRYWWVAPTYRQADIAYRRMRRAVRLLDQVRTNESDRTIQLPNGAVFEFRTAEHPDTLYGEDVWGVVLDEATRMRRAAWVAIRTTLTATEAPVRIIGNVKGSRNWAYQLAREAEKRSTAGDTAWHYAHITAMDAVAAGVLSAEEIEDARRTLNAADFAELYEARASESLSLVYAPFSGKNMTLAAEYEPGAGPFYVAYDWGFTDPTAIYFCQYRDGELYVFDELYGHGRSEGEWAQAVVRRVCELPDYVGPSFDDWAKVWSGRVSQPHWPDVWPDFAAGDPSAVQMRSEFKQRGISARAPKHVTHRVVSGQDVLRSLIMTANGVRRLFVHPRCVHLIESFEHFRATELEDGTFDPRPDAAPDNHVYSHAPDSMRYLAWAMRRMFGLQTMRDGDADGDDS